MRKINFLTEIVDRICNEVEQFNAIFKSFLFLFGITLAVNNWLKKPKSDKIENKSEEKIVVTDEVVEEPETLPEVIEETEKIEDPETIEDPELRPAEKENRV